MKSGKGIRDRWVNIRLKQEEFERVQKLYKATTCREMSSYCRAILQQKPVVFNYRDQSKEEILNVLIQLKRELNYIGHNYNQAVAKLHTLQTIPEIQAWLILSAFPQRNILKKIEEIKLLLAKFSQRW
jgi:predicted Fe-S protein YdhL (DUF1289 family)